VWRPGGYHVSVHVSSGCETLLTLYLPSDSTWATIFPLDVIKTRVQTQVLSNGPQAREERQGLLQRDEQGRRMSSLEIAKHAYRTEGAGVFFRGLGICSVRAFVVNAVQWAVYEWMMRLLQKPNRAT
jgi:solute carrier family 25 carnitine/acylcarnitine transporter 20/29